MDAGNRISASSSSLISSFKSFDLLANSPPKFSLSSDQLQRCSRALKFFKDKLQSPEIISREFRCLQMQDKRIRPSDMEKMCLVALDQVNLSKNRYRDVIPFDINRVVLKLSKDHRPSVGGYINASFVQTPSLANASRFIATQGPLPHTFEDFWEMVIQNRCPVIVMLTRLVDNYRVLQLVEYKLVKCGDYFPAEVGGWREFGGICVTTKWMKTTTSSLELRYLEVSKAESEEPPLLVLHIQYPEWPDNGVPRDTSAVREIFKQTCHMSPNLGPLLVHCSAGIGRTGTYCTIHDALQRILAGDMSALDLVNTVSVFRFQRVGMVQTKDQYLFIHSAVVDELEDLISYSNAGGRSS
ncbi:hypothetical protein Nepgr_024259 [Nepenthes gracilis]|uniref:protein-tyrosine-phosphatase n=1 Tax=Nepenthes gracilis TaxID=150966 RepID=A0AAD3T5Q7_NEPGR|nr:hypothetical protein Nepgr_024259 [Nepenthes gracilis]